MSTSEKTYEETLESLDGYEELAIKAQFGEGLGTYIGDGTSTDRRALIFIELKRGGATAKDAHSQVIKMRLGEVQDYFADEPVEEDPADPEPVTSSGKDDTPATSKQKSKQPSAS